MGPLALLLALITYADDPRPAAEPADQSLSIDEYLEKGVPSPDRVWSSQEYQEAREALAKIKEERKTALPRKGSGRSGAVFDRIISEENVRSPDGTVLSAQIRLANCGGILREGGGIFMLYLNPAGGKQEYGTECLALAGSMLRVFDATFRTMDEFMAQLPEDERNTPARQQSQRQMRSGLATSLVGMLTMLDERDQYGEDDLAGFAAQLARLVPPLWPRFEESTRKELTIRIRKKAEAHPDERVRRSMADLQKAIAGPAEPAPPSPGPDRP
jgi:hypothetical protein